MAKSKGRRLAEWLRNLDSSGTVSNLTSTGIDDNATSTAITIDASENVGIGTASPAEVLHVADTTTAGAVGLRAENSEGHVNFTTNGGGFQFETGASGTVAVIDSSGNVGIGTASPDSILHLSAGSAAKIIIEDTANPRQNYIGIDGSDNLVLAADEDNLGASSNMQFRVDATERMRINSSGNVGIGTTSPAYPLDVIGTLRVQHSGTDTFSTIRGPGNRTLRIDIDANGDTDSLTVRDLRDGSDRFTVQAGGNVGIGTASPDADLEIRKDNSSGLGAVLSLTNSNNSGNTGNSVAIGLSAFSHTPIDNASYRGAIIKGETTATGNGHSLIFETSDTSLVPAERMRIDHDGNVGIGTSSPDQLLDVGDHTAVGNRSIRISQRTGTAEQTYGGLEFFYNNTAGTTGVNAAIKYASGPLRNDGELTFHTGASASISERLRIDHNGKVTVYGISRFENYIEFAGSISTPATSAAIYRPADNTLAFSTANTERMRIDSSGNVGIGTASAGNLLHIHEGSSAGAWAHFTNTTTSAGGSSGVLVGLDSNEDFRVLQYGAKAVAFYTSTTERMRINSSGNVGIGTTSPTNPLTVQANSGAGAVALNGRSSDGIATLGFYASNGTTAQGYVQGRSDSLRLWAASGDYLSLGSSDTERMHIDSSGNVGIGTSSPSSYGYFAVDRGAPASADRTIAAFMAQSTRRMGLVWDDSKSTLGLANLTSQDLCFHIGGIGGASEIMRLQSSGNVGIGTESPVSLLHIEGNAAAGGLTLGRSSSNSAGNVLGVLQFKNEDGSNDGPNVVANIQAVVPNSNGSGGYLTFGTHDGTEGGEGSSPVERMRILSTGGITFNGDTAAANALDDYEEGTWTPVLNGSPTHSASNQYYVKIGNLVYAGAYIYSISDYTSATNFSIAGLPYATNNARGVGSVMFRDINDTTIAQLNSYISTSSSTVFFYASQNNGGNWDTLEYADGDSGLIDIIFNITYLVS